MALSQHLEPAFIAQYRKEQVAPLLRGRADEWMHPPSDNGPLPLAKVARWELLWAVDEWDKRYLVLEQVRAVCCVLRVCVCVCVWAMSICVLCRHVVLREVRRT